MSEVLQRVESAVAAIFPEDYLKQGLKFVTIAAEKFVDNTQRREWAVAKIMQTLKVPEFAARLLVEVALRSAKQALSQVAPE